MGHILHFIAFFHIPTFSSISEKSNFIMKQLVQKIKRLLWEIFYFLLPRKKKVSKSKKTYFWYKIIVIMTLCLEGGIY